MTLAEALASLLEAARSVEGLVSARGDDPKALTLPAVAVGLPTPSWETYGPDPSTATFPVTLMVRLDTQAIDTLLGYVAILGRALEDTGGRITACTPVSYDLDQGVTAAAYELTVTFPL